MMEVGVGVRIGVEDGVEVELLVVMVDRGVMGGEGDNSEMNREATSVGGNANSVRSFG